ncbi:MAG: DUF4440 domain-containing protein [Acidimicrobiia bacterium]|nr:DUF4440 domain-containing protein [Acidimicrobiia bacterium]
MKRRNWVVSIAVGALWLTGCQQQQPAVDLEAEKKAVMEMEASWVKAAAAKDVEAFVAFYADNAVVLEPNKPAHHGKEAIRAGLKEIFGLPGFALSFQSTRVEVAKSGDMAWSTGGYTMSFQDPKGNTMNDRGKFVTAFEKDAAGQWKVTADMFSSDLPAPGAPAEAAK